VTVRYRIQFPQNYGAGIKLEDPAVSKKYGFAGVETEFTTPAVMGKASKSSLSLSVGGAKHCKREFTPVEIEPECKLYLPLQEGSGDEVGDLSSEGNHGTIEGATWKQLNGVYYLSFDRIDDRVNCGVASSTAGAYFLVEAWGFVAGSLIDYGSLLSRFDGSVKRNYLVGFTYLRHPFGRVSDGVTVWDVTYPISWLLNIWTQIAFAGLRDKYILFVNGEKKVERNRAIEPSIGGYTMLGYADPRYHNGGVGLAKVLIIAEDTSEAEVSYLVKKWFEEERSLYGT